jgi:hypothetical protein
MGTRIGVVEEVDDCGARNDPSLNDQIDANEWGGRNPLNSMLQPLSARPRGSNRRQNGYGRLGLWRNRASGHLILPIISSIILLSPVVISYRMLGIRALFNFFANDAMYYGQIANNFTKFGFPTSDGLTTTNGFQPLWGWLLICVFKSFRVAHDQQLFVLFGLSAACVALAYAILSSTFYQLFGLFAGLIATLSLFPGLYPVVFEPTTRYGGETGLLYALGPWSAINGVESPIVILTWSLLFLFLARNYMEHVANAGSQTLRLTNYFPPAARWCLAAILLCRLEQGLIFIAITIICFVTPADNQVQRLRGLAIILLPSVIVTSIYIAYNLAAVGVPLPVSGLSKVRFGLVGNLRYLWHVMVGGMNDVWWFAAIRLYPIIFGACAGVVMLAAAARCKRDRGRLRGMSVYLAVFGLFLLMNSTLLFIFEPIGLIGYWYYWPMVLVPAIFVAMPLGYWARRVHGLGGASLTICCAILFFHYPNELHFTNSTTVARVFQFSDHQEISSQLWTFRQPIRNDILRRYPHARLVDTFDGVFGFALDLPARSITGLVSSPAELKRRREVGFWRSAVEDGFDIVPAYGYLDMQIEGRDIKVLEEFRPPSSPVIFYRVELRPVGKQNEHDHAQPGIVALQDR